MPRSRGGGAKEAAWKVLRGPGTAQSESPPELSEYCYRCRQRICHCLSHWAPRSWLRRDLVTCRALWELWSVQHPGPVTCRAVRALQSLPRDGSVVCRPLWALCSVAHGDCGASSRSLCIQIRGTPWLCTAPAPWAHLDSVTAPAIWALQSIPHGGSVAARAFWCHIVTMSLPEFWGRCASPALAPLTYHVLAFGNPAAFPGAAGKGARSHRATT